MRINKNQRHLFICFIFFMLICTNKVFAVWYSGGSGSDVQSGLTGTGNNNNNSNSGPSNTNNQNQNQTGPSGPSGPSGPTGPTSITYPDPTTAMSDSELKEISEKGNSQQRSEAERIIAEREHKRENAKLLAECNGIDSDINILINQEIYIQESLQNASLSEEIKEEIYTDINLAENKLEESIEASVVQLAENIVENENTLQIKNSQESGDPVKITEGSYEQHNIDFHFSKIMDFPIKRRYSSSGTIVSSFGYGWYTNLDERIILGTEVEPEKMWENLLSYSDYLKEKIKEYEGRLSQYYKVTDIYHAEEFYREEIRKTENQLSRASDLYSKTKSLLARASWYEAKDDIAEVKQKIESLILRLNDKISLFETIIEGIREHLEKVSLYKEAYKQSLLEIGAYKDKYDLSMNRKNKNIRAMFSGMSLWWEETGLDSLTLIDENGYPHLFIESNSEEKNWLSADSKEFLEIRLLSDGYELIQRDGLVKYFYENGLIKKIIDRNDNYILINRETDGRIISLESSTSEKLNFDYDSSGKFIIQITNTRSPDENVQYSYSGNKLATIKDAEDEFVEIEYDESNRMCALKKCDGCKIIFEYGEMDSTGNLIATSIKNEEGFSEYFIYDKLQHHTEYIDHDNNRYSYWYDDKCRTEKELQPDGSIILMEYDDNDLLTKKVINGFATQYSYDEAGNIILADYNNNSKETWNYNEFGQVTLHTDPDNIKEEYLYDEKGNLSEYKRGGQTVYSQIHNQQGQVIRITQYCQLPVITDYEYDIYGNLIAETRAGVKKEYIYDARNRLSKIIKAGKTMAEYSYEKNKKTESFYNGLENVYLTNGRKDVTGIIQKDILTGNIHQSRIEYDKRHLPVYIYAGDGVSEELLISYLYTAEGKISAEIKYGDECWIRLYEYEAGQINAVKQFMINNPDAVFKVSNSRKALDELLLLAGENVYIQTYNYAIKELNGKTLILTDNDGSTKFFEYDLHGNLIKNSGENGQLLEHLYTKAGRKLSDQSLYGGWYKYKYNSAGLLINSGEEGRPACEAEYYPDGSLKVSIDFYGNQTYYNYDERGRIISSISDSKEIWFEYDDFDRVISKVIGQTKSESAATYYESFEYSEDGRSMTLIEGDKYERTFRLDAFGNIIKEIDGNTNERSFVYNHLNQLIESYDAYENKKSYSYNALNQIKSVILPQGENISFQYNYMGLLLSVKDDCGILYSAEYDKAGRLIKERSRADSEKLYQYDSNGRKSALVCGDEVVESYFYGSYGRSNQVYDGNGNVYTYNYDAFGRLINEENRIGLSQNYEYDEAGQLKSKRTFDNGLINISFSNDRKMRQITFQDGSQSRFLYDELGNLLEAENDSGKISFQYDRGGRLIFQKDHITGEEIYFEYDKAGNRISMECSNRKTTYTYGKNNELKELFDNKQRLSLSFMYDNNGREILRLFGNGVKEESIYDKAGRIIVKTHKSARGELLWGQGYIYGEDGKRSSSVDFKGRITFYEYNKAGQLSEVYYPYTDYLIDMLKKEAELNGLTIKNELGVNRFLTSEEKAAMSFLLEQMNPGLSYSLSNLQTFIREKYTYDKNGNRKSKTTNLGTIEYTYDSENCLISSGNNGRPFINYTYDSLGNIISEKADHYSIEYSYNAQGRLAYCEVFNHFDKSYSQSLYDYDALGRRTLIEDNNETAIRTLYEGLSFDVIKQSPVLPNGMFTDSSENGIHWGNNGKPNGGRYRYISDEKDTDGNRYYNLKDDSYKMVKDRFAGERTIVSYNDRPLAQYTSEGQDYFSTDILGSITSVTDLYGLEKKSFDYDAFGSCIQGKLSGAQDFGYLGKQKDPASGLYNYGYRDYTPQLSRFTTIDPIRDGYNWFTYCSNDPVNFIDHLGLDQIAVSGDRLMQDKEWKNTKIKDVDYEFITAGCAIMGVADVFNESPNDVNNNYVTNGFIDWSEAAKNHNQTAERKYTSFTKDIFLSQVDDSEKTFQTLVNVNYDEGNHDHWVGVKDVITVSNKDYVVINPTSVNDKMTSYDVWNYYDEKIGKTYYSDARLNKGWIVVKGDVLVPVTETKGYVNFIETNKEK